MGEKIAYVRVSTIEQNEARQVEELKKHNIQKWFIEKIQEIYKNETHIISDPIITTKIKACKYNNNSNLLGALLYAKKKLATSNNN